MTFPTQPGPTPPVDPQLRAWLSAQGVAPDFLPVYEHVKAMIWGAVPQPPFHPMQVDQAVARWAYHAPPQQLQTMRDIGMQLVRYFHEGAMAPPGAAASSTPGPGGMPSAGTIQQLKAVMGGLDRISDASIVGIDGEDALPEEEEEEDEEKDEDEEEDEEPSGEADLEAGLLGAEPGAPDEDDGEDEAEDDESSDAGLLPLPATKAPDKPFVPAGGDLEVDWSASGRSAPARPTGLSHDPPAATSTASLRPMPADASGPARRGSANLSKVKDRPCSCSDGRRKPHVAQPALWAVSFLAAGLFAWIVKDIFGLFGILAIASMVAAASALGSIFAVRMKCRTCNSPTEPRDPGEDALIANVRKRQWNFAFGLGVLAAVFGIIRFGGWFEPPPVDPADTDRVAQQLLEREQGNEEATTFLGADDASMFEWGYAPEPIDFVSGAYDRGATDVWAAEIERIGDVRFCAKFIVALPDEKLQREALLAWCDEQFPGLCDRAGDVYVVAATD